MATAPQRPGFEYMSFDDFEELLLDKPDHEKWELIGGRVIRGMVGARWEHNRIVQNIASALLTGLRAQNSICRPFVETFWLKEKSINLSVFPDVIVRCGRMSVGATYISDPVVLFEVLSESTEKRDRQSKWELYQQLPTLKHYVLVESGALSVGLFSRDKKGWDAYHQIKGPDEMLRLPAISFEMPVAEIYRDVIL